MHYMTRALGTRSRPLFLLGIQGVPCGFLSRTEGLHHSIDVLGSAWSYPCQHQLTMLTPFTPTCRSENTHTTVFTYQYALHATKSSIIVEHAQLVLHPQHCVQIVPELRLHLIIALNMAKFVKQKAKFVKQKR